MAANTFACEMWNQIVSALKHKNVLDKLDKFALEVMCLTYADFRRASAEYEKADCRRLEGTAGSIAVVRDHEYLARRIPQADRRVRLYAGRSRADWRGHAVGRVR